MWCDRREAESQATRRPPTSQIITIEFKRSSGEQNEEWTVDESRVKAFLSLWTYSSRKAREREITQTRDIQRHNRAPQSRPNGGYFYLLSEKRSDECIYMKKCLQKIPGSSGPSWIRVRLPEPEVTLSAKTRHASVFRYGICGVELKIVTTEIEPPLVAFQCQARFPSTNNDAETACGPSQFLGNAYRFPRSPGQGAMEAIQRIRSEEDASFWAYQYPDDRSIEIANTCTRCS